MHQYLVLDKKETEPVDPLSFIRIKNYVLSAGNTGCQLSLWQHSQRFYWTNRKAGRKFIFIRMIVVNDDIRL